MGTISRRSAAAADEFAVVARFFEGQYAHGEPHPDACDLTFGNPHEMPLPGLVDAIARHAQPHDPSWFAYKTSEPNAQRVVAEALGRELGLAFEPDDIAMTQGAFGAIALAFQLVLDAGDEVIIPVPGWFCYAPMLRAANLVPIPVPLDPEDFDLDVAAIEAAITPRTRMVVVNSPANPTGRIYDRRTWERLADVVESASARLGHRLYLLSDEPYRRIRFDDLGFVSPAAIYPWTMIDYSYGKVLLAPGQRLGYLALSPLMPDRDRLALRGAMFPTQMALGWTFPNAVMQYAVEDLEALSIDIAALQSKRDRMLEVMTGVGYDLTRPQGTFYLWGAAPGGDAVRFCEWLAARHVHVMPGTLFDRPGDFRISLTASSDMVERALPHLRAAADAL